MPMITPTIVPGIVPTAMPVAVHRQSQDACKTCCRDPVLLAPLVARGLPMAVAEFSLNTGFPGSPAFYRDYYFKE